MYASQGMRAPQVSQLAWTVPVAILLACLDFTSGQTFLLGVPLVVCSTLASLHNMPLRKWVMLSIRRPPSREERAALALQAVARGMHARGTIRQRLKAMAASNITQSQRNLLRHSVSAAGAAPAGAAAVGTARAQANGSEERVEVQKRKAHRRVSAVEQFKINREQLGGKAAAGSPAAVQTVGGGGGSSGLPGKSEFRGSQQSPPASRSGVQQGHLSEPDARQRNRFVGQRILLSTGVKEGGAQQRCASSGPDNRSVRRLFQDPPPGT